MNADPRVERAARRLQQAWEDDRDALDDDGYEWDSLDAETQQWYRDRAREVLDAADPPFGRNGLGSEV